MNFDFVKELPEDDEATDSISKEALAMAIDSNNSTTNMPDSDIKEGMTIYPHTGIAIIEIIKAWSVIALMIAGLFYAGQTILPPDLRFYANLGCFLLVLGAAAFAVQRILHYTNTYVEITKDALIYRRGWIPHSIDTIFWVHIKDINSSASVTESLLKTGSIKVIVAIRANMALVEVNYLPNHEKFAQFIRERIGKFSDATRQVTYT